MLQVKTANTLTRLDWLYLLRPFFVQFLVCPYSFLGKHQQNSSNPLNTMLSVVSTTQLIIDFHFFLYIKIGSARFPTRPLVNS